MGQKTNPIGNRLGYIKGWDSNWYGGDDYKDKIVLCGMAIGYEDKTEAINSYRTPREDLSQIAKYYS